MNTLPANVVPYKRTPEFDQHSIPAGLRRSHTTRTGTWARIVVLEGTLLYRILEPEVTEHLLSDQVPGIVEPGVAHEVAAPGAVRFYVEFLKAPD